MEYNPDPESVQMRHGYFSMPAPPLFEMNLDTGERKLLKKTEMKNFQADHYRPEWPWITARNGVEVPVSPFYRKDLFKSGCNPLLDRGFVFALTHIRGDKLGQEWYEDGTLFNKMNFFNDFIDISRELLR